MTEEIEIPKLSFRAKESYEVKAGIENVFPIHSDACERAFGYVESRSDAIQMARKLHLLSCTRRLARAGNRELLDEHPGLFEGKRRARLWYV